ncbi:hypothetical protein [Mycobacterium sp. 852013-51886_SCH5428379]|uniref:hypothetical protein n=1 Tax=Mycobacterium sp. 852013-51886_SCH5428379 TaxID=1834111 RepID=UPI000A51F201|nr:hypothetical protein [Mycobacterium sp. 852013-51886_SCH5428379]
MRAGSPVTICLLICLLSACTQERGIERWEGTNAGLRYLWTAGPGIDITTGPAVPIRAFMESFELSQDAGDMSYAYPGFEQAVPDSSSDLWQTRPALDVPSKTPAVGNVNNLILSLDRVNDVVSAVVCRYTYRVATETENGFYRSVARVGAMDERGIDVSKVELSGRSSQPELAQAGPRPDPIGNVFGEWRVRGMLAYFSKNEPGFDQAWPTYEADRQACVDKAPDPLPVRNAIIDGTHPRSEFPTAPASPGWPENPSE